MFNPFTSEDPALENAIAAAFADLQGYTAETDEHRATVNQLTELYALKKKTVDPNTLLTVLGNIGLGLAVINYERTAVVTTKLWSFLTKV